MSKTYTKRTNAKRAAVAAGIPEDQVEITVHKSVGEAPRFGFKQKESAGPARARTAAKGAVKGKGASPAQAPVRVRRNGVARPRAGGLCAAVWAWLDKHPDAKLADVRAAAEKQGWNVNNASIELYTWRKFSAEGERAA